MGLKNTEDTYGSVSKTFHWLIATLVIVMLSFGFFMGNFPKEYKPVIYNVHKLIGLSILFLSLLRVAWRSANTRTNLITDGTLLRSIENVCARGVHVALYLTVILMTLVGWIGSAAAGRPPRLGDFAFNLPIPLNKPLSHTMFDLHYWLAIMIIGLVSIHVLGALYHHFLLKDNVLRRML